MTPPNRALLRKISCRLADERDQILEDWLSAVHGDRRIQSAERVSRLGLVDHLPKLLLTITEMLRFEYGETAEQIGEDARKHGGFRWEQGYNLEELVRELMIFRSVLIRHLVSIEAAEEPLPFDVRLMVTERIHRLLDEVTWTSTEQFVREQQNNLVRANEARARLIRNVSHELRNVLNGLGLAAELIEDERSEPVKEMRSTLWRNVEHMRELLDDLLDLSALVSKQQVARPSEFEPGALQRQLDGIYRPMAEAKGLQFRTDLDPTLESVFGDERKIEQVAANLLSNAIKYTDHGEVVFSLQGINETQWSLAVSDTGAGISKEDQKEIFSEFYRVESTSQARGVGLGLAITTRLVDLLLGELRLSSTRGEGSRFEVILPKVYQPKVYQPKVPADAVLPPLPGGIATLDDGGNLKNP